MPWILGGTMSGIFLSSDCTLEKAFRISYFKCSRPAKYPPTKPLAKKTIDGKPKRLVFFFCLTLAFVLGLLIAANKSLFIFWIVTKGVGTGTRLA